MQIIRIARADKAADRHPPINGSNAKQCKLIVSAASRQNENGGWSRFVAHPVSKLRLLSNPLLEACGNEIVKVAIEHGLGIADFVIGT